MAGILRVPVHCSLGFGVLCFNQVDPSFGVHLVGALSKFGRHTLSCSVFPFKFRCSTFLSALFGCLTRVFGGGSFMRVDGSSPIIVRGSWECCAFLLFSSFGW